MFHLKTSTYFFLVPQIMYLVLAWLISNPILLAALSNAIVASWRDFGHLLIYQDHLHILISALICKIYYHAGLCLCNIIIFSSAILNKMQANASPCLDPFRIWKLSDSSFCTLTLEVVPSIVACVNLTSVVCQILALSYRAESCWPYHMLF
jgi:hypothetical protein